LGSNSTMAELAEDRFFRLNSAIRDHRCSVAQKVTDNSIMGTTPHWKTLLKSRTERHTILTRKIKMITCENCTSISSQNPRINLELENAARNKNDNM
jgi:hypothetical protein